MESTFAHTYRNVQNTVQSESDSSDSDSEDDAWKRRSSRKRVIPKSPVKASETKLPLTTDDGVSSNTKKRKLNTVWCNVLQEQTVADDLIQFGIKSKPVSYQDRSCESYDFRLSALDPRREAPMEECDFSVYKGNSGDDDETKLDEEDANENSDHKNGSQNRWPKSVPENPEIVNKVAKKIIKVLNEPKHYIIYRAVKVIGSKRALELLEETEKIEDDGGMFVLDKSRRRTPGGTFLQLLKKDTSVSNKKKSIIFAEDRRALSGKALKYKHKKKKKANKTTEAMDIVCGPTDMGKEEKEINYTKEANGDKDETNEKKGTVLEENGILNIINGTNIEDVDENACAKEDSELEEGEITD